MNLSNDHSIMIIGLLRKTIREKNREIEKLEKRIAKLESKGIKNGK